MDGGGWRAGARAIWWRALGLLRAIFRGALVAIVLLLLLLAALGAAIFEPDL